MDRNFRWGSGINDSIHGRKLPVNSRYYLQSKRFDPIKRYTMCGIHLEEDRKKKSGKRKINKQKKRK